MRGFLATVFLLTSGLLPTATGSPPQEVDRNLFVDGYLAGWLNDLSVDPDIRIELASDVLALSKTSALPVRPGPQAGAVVPAIITREALAAGMDPVYLVKVARRESGLNPVATAQTSSAAGLFQFIDNTWLCALRRYGRPHSADAAISEDRSGRCHVDDQVQRGRLLDLRFDVAMSARMAAVLSRENYQRFQEVFGRGPSADELYVMHVLGADKGLAFLEAARQTPSVSGTMIDEAAARANPQLFYALGRPLSAAQVIDRLRLAPGPAHD